MPPIEAVQNSLVFALIATLICAPLGLMAALVIARGKGRLASGFDALLMLPLGTSAVIVGFGFLVALGNLPFDLRTSVILIPIAHAIVALPFLVRATVPVLRSVDDRLRDAARVLGASPTRVWREIDLPIVKRAVLIGAGFAFAVSPGRVRRDAVHRPSRRADHARRHLSTLEPARRACLRPGHGHGRAAHGRDRRLRARASTGCRPSRESGRLMLELVDVRVAYGETVAVDGVSLTIGDNETVALLGPSGSGKSTLLRAIAGLEPLAGGRISLDGRDLADVPVHERGLGLMFQDYVLFPQRDVRGNVAFGLEMRGDARDRRSTRASTRFSSWSACAATGHDGRRSCPVASSNASRWPGRWLRRPGCSCSTSRLARSTARCGRGCSTSSPRSLRELRLPILYVTHDQEEAFTVADRVAIMRDGRAAAISTPVDLWSRPPDAWTARFLGFHNVADAEIRAGTADSPWGPSRYPVSPTARSPWCSDQRP